MEFINAGISFDSSGIQAGMKEAATAIVKGGEQIGNAAQGAATKSDFAFKSLAQAYRQTSKDAQFLAETQGINSKAFLDAAVQAGQYKNKLDDINLVIGALGADKPVLQATLNLAQGIAGGFAAAQGAVAMFGGKSKEVDEALKKVNGSLALLQGLTALTGLPDAWKGFATTLNTKVIPALTTTRGLMMTMGIGALVVAVGFLANAWMNAAEKQEKAIQAQKDLKENLKKSQDIIDEYTLTEKQKAIKKENEDYDALIRENAKRRQAVKTHYDQMGREVIDYEAEAKTDRKKEYAERELIEKTHRQNLADIETKFAPKKEKDEKIKKAKAENYQKNRDPEKERIKRKENMHRHVEYCRKPEYKAKKSDYDKKKRLDEYGYFSECKKLLMELEKEIRSRITRYEIYVANGRFTRSAIERRRELCRSRKI